MNLLWGAGLMGALISTGALVLTQSPPYSIVSLVFFGIFSFVGGILCAVELSKSEKA